MAVVKSASSSGFSRTAFADRGEQFDRAFLRAADETDERAVARQNRPQRRQSGQRGLARPARHGEREQAAFLHRPLDLLNDAEEVFRPAAIEGAGEVGFAKEAEVGPGAFPPRHVGDVRQRRDVLRPPGLGVLAFEVGSAGVDLRLGRPVHFADEPAQVLQQPGTPAVVPAPAGPVHLPVQP